jgi:DNA polymerase-1
MRTKNEYQPHNPPIMVFDGMNLAYTAYYAYAKLRGSQILYGVPEIIRAFLHRYNPQKIMVVWDGARHPRRLELLPGYKSHRKERPEGFNDQLKRVRRLLYYMGIPQVLNKEIEGDDMIHLVVERLKKTHEHCKIRIISGDKDFYQLIDDRTWVEATRVDGTITTKELFKAHTSINHPSQHVDYLCFIGDKSDDIPGYLGIGEGKRVP